jgi:hypothetical protein
LESGSGAVFRYFDRRDPGLKSTAYSRKSLWD